MLMARRSGMAGTMRVPRSGRVRWRAIAAVVLIAVLAGPVGSAAAEELEQAVPVRYQTRDGGKLIGRMIARDAKGFKLRDRDGETRRVGWGKLSPRIVYRLYGRTLGRDGNAWLELGKVLLEHDGKQAGAWADRALKRAARLDPSLADKAEKLRKKGAAAAAEEGEEDGPPKRLRWPELSDEQQAEAVKKLKAYAEKTQKKIEVRLNAYETDYFLFCTNLGRREAQRWQSLLDSMYSRLLRVFGLPEGKNIWRGKALVFVFEDQEDFIRYEQTMEDYNPGGSVVGLCHQQGNGIVRIAFYRHGNDKDFASTLVHESVHGFIHRYRSKGRVISWVNEGLAEWISYQLVPQPGKASELSALVRSLINQKGGIGWMFGRRQISAIQYPIAYTLTRFMINQNRSGYVDFIQAIKDGVGWRKALKEEYGTTLPKLVSAYAEQMNLSNLELDPKDLRR